MPRRSVRADGKPLTSAERSRRAREKKAKLAGGTPPQGVPVLAPSSSSSSSAAGASTATPPAGASTASKASSPIGGNLPVHETPRLEGGAAGPEAWSSVPKVDPAEPGGQPEQVAAPPAPQVDEEARRASAKRFGVFVGVCAGAGLAAGVELLKASEQVPPAVKAMIDAHLSQLKPEHVGAFINAFELAGERVALKHGISVPAFAYQDELLVVAGVGGGAAAFIANEIRKRKARAVAGGEQATPTAQPGVDVVKAPPPASRPANGANPSPRRPRADWSEFGDLSGAGNMS